MANLIKTKITCENLARLSKFNQEIESDALKLAIFANNGSGKTFLSRMFRLAEKNYSVTEDDNGNPSTDKMISFEKNKSSFSLKITDKENKITEDFSISISSGSIPAKPSTNYIYHSFNEDYVEENIRVSDYEKDSNIEGFILGKINIDLSNEKEARFKKMVERDKLGERIHKDINKFVTDKTGSVANIKRLGDYKSLSPDAIISGVDTPFTDVTRSSGELLNDYNRIKSTPENLPDIRTIQYSGTTMEEIFNIEATLKKVFSLGNFAEAFKEKIKAKQEFIETGLSILQGNDHCPFCEQSFDSSASSLIDQYTKYLEDEEARTVRLLNQHKDNLRNMLRSFMRFAEEVNERTILYNEYSSKYIPSLEGTALEALSIEDLKEMFTFLAKEIDKKIGSIDSPIIPDKNIINDIEAQLANIDSVLSENNMKIEEINQRKNAIDAENKEVRRNLCKAVFNELTGLQKGNISDLHRLTVELEELDRDIREKEEKQQISKKKKVAQTIEDVLQYIFGNKYSFDKESFSLTLNKTALEPGQAKNVLSAGEKNILAFAYFLGDTHLKVEKNDDYDKLFFVIDDPVVGMDLNHIYSVGGVIRNLKEIIHSDHQRFIILTHNLDFMKVLGENEIVCKSLMLEGSSLVEFDQNIISTQRSKLLLKHIE